MGTYRTTVEMAWTVASGSPGTNVWYYRTVGVPQGELEDTTEALRVFYTAIKGIYPNPVKITSDGIWTGVSQGEAGDEVVAPTWSVTGSAGTGWAPPGLAVTLGLRTPSGGRSGRGRRFLGPLGANVIGPDGTLMASERQAIGTAALALMGADSDNGGHLAVYSRTQNITRDVTNVEVSPTFAMLRSRRD